MTDKDKKLFEQLYLKYKGVVFGVIFGITKDRVRAAELVSDVFTRAYLNFHTVRDKKLYRAWLIAIAKNTAITFVEQRRRNIQIYMDNDEFIDILYYHDIHNNPNTLLDTAIKKEGISEVFNSLTPDERLLLSMVSIDTMYYDDIAIVMGIPDGTVKSRMHFLREKLRPKLESYR